jgi:hypothetical protein
MLTHYIQVALSRYFIFNNNYFVSKSNTGAWTLLQGSERRNLYASNSFCDSKHLGSAEHGFVLAGLPCFLSCMHYQHKRTLWTQLKPSSSALVLIAWSAQCALTNMHLVLSSTHMIMRNQHIPLSPWSLLLSTRLLCRVGQNRIYIRIYIHRIFGDFQAKNTVCTPDIYGSGQPYSCAIHGYSYVHTHSDE